MDRDLLSQILGRPVWPRALTPALLRGYRRQAVGGRRYPVVMPHRGGSVKGVVLRGVMASERDRLCAYEGEGYELASAVAEPRGKAPRRVVFFKPKPGAYKVTNRPWSLAGWQLHRKRSQRLNSLAPQTGRGRDADLGLPAPDN
jgi:hypothetical protein